MSVTAAETVKKISRLAKLALSASETDKYSEQLSRVLRHMEVLNEVDAANVEPMYHGCVEAKNMRSDEAKAFDTERLLNSAVFVKEDYFSVPSIIKTE